MGKLIAILIDLLVVLLFVAVLAWLVSVLL